MSRVYVILCGVPSEYCFGSRYKTDQQLPKRGHHSRREARRCYIRYISKILGWEKADVRHPGTKGYIDPDTGHILVITKVSKFGEMLRWGKEHARFMPGGKRNRGVIIG
jgi:hypothetical protein